MPAHHFTTPRVVYLGLAHGAKEDRQPRAATGGVRRGPDRPGREQVAMRRSERRPQATLR
jgi:hypothetical protein